MSTPPAEQYQVRHKRMKHAEILLLVAVVLVTASCDRAPSHTSEDSWRKVELDLSQLDRDGLRGPDDGKVEVSYEFAIPNSEDCKARVRAIDSSVRFMPGSSGRIGATRDQCLCIGSTHQDNYRSVLQKLAELPFVKRMIECYFE